MRSEGKVQLMIFYNTLCLSYFILNFIRIIIIIIFIFTIMTLQDFDECRASIRVCSNVNAKCRNTYRCSCKSVFLTGNGITCTGKQS